MDQDDKPLPSLDLPSGMEPLLRRIAEGVERLEKRGPAAIPPAVSGSEPQASIPASQAAPDQSPIPQPSFTPRQPPAMPESLKTDRIDPSQPPAMPERRFANAGNIDIEPPKGQRDPSVFGRAAVSLQSMTNMLADYGVQSPVMHNLTSYAKTASLMAGDQHTRGEGLAKKGLVPNTGGDENSVLRSIELMGKKSSSIGEPSDSSPQIARNDLKDSIDSLKEAIDQLKDAVKDGSQSKQQATAAKTTLRGTDPATVNSSGQRSRPTQMGNMNPAAVRGLMNAFGL